MVAADQGDLEESTALGVKKPDEPVTKLEVVALQLQAYGRFPEGMPPTALA